MQNLNEKFKMNLKKDRIIMLNQEKKQKANMKRLTKLYVSSLEKPLKGTNPPKT